MESPAERPRRRYWAGSVGWRPTGAKRKDRCGVLQGPVRGSGGHPDPKIGPIGDLDAFAHLGLQWLDRESGR